MPIFSFWSLENLMGNFTEFGTQKRKEKKIYQNSESEHFEREFVFVENIRSQLLTNHLPPNLFIPWDIFTCTTAHVYTPPLPLTDGQTAPLFVSTLLFRPPPLLLFYYYDGLNYLETSKECILCQGCKGIRQWPINYYISPKMIHKITPSINYNKLLKRLDTQLHEPTY